MAVRIIQGWSSKPAGRPVRPAGFAMLAMLIAVGMAPVAAQAATPLTATVAVAAKPKAKAAPRPNWFAEGNRAPEALFALIETSKLDGLNPGKFKLRAAKKAVRGALEGDPKDYAEAQALLERALVVYASALRSQSSGEWKIVDREAAAGPVPSMELLANAAAVPSLAAWIENMGFMHPDYAPLRRQLAFARDRGDKRTEDLLRINLKRARFLPGTGRYVVVNSAAQRLYIYENGRAIDSMKVVVGKPAQPTPMMAALIRYTAVNPYWNVPSDLAAERIAPNVVKDGLRYLKAHGYVVLSDWGAKAKPVNPATIDWDAVAAGKVELRLRQNPGPANSMGRMKFMFPNAQGVYLHDTPNKELMGEDARLFSGGCVRLEDAPRLAKWLYGKPLKIGVSKPEQKVELPKPIPVYLTYMTAVPSGGSVTYFEDIYGRDQAQLNIKPRKRGLFASR